MIGLITRTVDDLERIMRASNVEGLKQWIQEVRRSKTSVDINRITRYATSQRRVNFVKYLVEEEGAKLEQKDKLGRSIVFYAVSSVGPTDTDMVEYICGEMGTETFQKEMSHQDVEKRTPWYYAGSLACFEYCLTAGARPNDHEVTMLERRPFTWEGSKHHSQLLLMLYTHLQSYLDFPVYTEIEDEKKKYPYTKLLKIRELHANPGLLPHSRRQAWIHIPWTNVS